MDDNNVRIGSLTQEVDALRQSVQQLGTAPPAGGRGERPGRSPAPAPDPSSAAAAVPPAPTAVGASPQKLYDSAWTDYTTGQYDLAMLGFESYIKSFPALRPRRRCAGLHRQLLPAGRQERQGGRSLRPGDPHLPDRQPGPGRLLQEGHRAPRSEGGRTRASRRFSSSRNVSRQQRRHPRQAAARPIAEAVASRAASRPALAVLAGVMCACVSRAPDRRCRIVRHSAIAGLRASRSLSKGTVWEASTK